MDQNTYILKCSQWEAIIQEANSSGMPKIEWCRLHGISKSQFYYWKRKIEASAMVDIRRDQNSKSEALQDQTSSLIELRPPAADTSELEATLQNNHLQTPINHQAGLLMRFGPYEIEIGSPKAEETLRMTMRVLRNA